LLSHSLQNVNIISIWRDKFFLKSYIREDIAVNTLELVEDISIPSPTRVILIAIDGLGGLPDSKTSKTELETAQTPILDHMAFEGNCGLMDPVRRGITPGSVPGHLAIFGFDPLIYTIGRGAMEAIGINFDLQADDVVARGNFATVDEDNLIVDRRAGRIITERTSELCRLLDGMEIQDVKLMVRPLKDYRFIVVFRGLGLASAVSDSDPQLNGVPPRKIMPLNEPAGKTADIANKFIARAKALLANHKPANMILLRGFSKRPQFPSISEIYKLKAASISYVPVYRGLSQLVGIDVLDTGNSLDGELNTLENYFKDYNFFFLHIKQVDTAGEDGDFERKVKLIEETDKALERIIKLKPDVTVVTSDHSTPATLGLHSWHPVPVLIHSKLCRPDKIMKFSEFNCLHGGLGRFPATQLMPQVMAHAQKLGKFGA
jgi:2,3-bisphosphoglycerate-independent phosphoglycerate mutase